MGGKRAAAVADRRPLLVVGAGVSGLCAAIFLARRGFAVEVWEAAPQPGGLLAPIEFRGVACDLGSHRLHGDALPALASAAPGLSWQQRPRRGVLLLGGRHIAYPLRLFDFLRGLGPGQALRFGTSFLTRQASLGKFASWERDRVHSGSDDSDDPGFERFVRDRVGHSAYAAFYRPYVEKVWGLPPSELSSVVAKKRIATSRPFAPASQPTHFHYPSLGMGALIAALCVEAERLGVAIHYGQRYRPADRPAATEWQAIVYSGPLAALCPQAPLAHRGLYLIYLAFAVDELGPVDTYYAPEGRYWFGRVSVPSNFSAAQKAPGEIALCVEIPEGRWGSRYDFLGRLDALLAQLRQAGILPPGLRPVAAQQHYLPAVYPIYRRGFTATWRRSLASLAVAERLFPLGRQGLFLHCNIDHCVQMARDLADHLTNGGSSADWLASADRYLTLQVRD